VSRWAGELLREEAGRRQAAVAAAIALVGHAASGLATSVLYYLYTAYTIEAGADLDDRVGDRSRAASLAWLLVAVAILALVFWPRLGIRLPAMFGLAAGWSVAVWAVWLW
jgi:hypothetical protein